LTCHGVRLLLTVGEEKELKIKPLHGIGEDEELLVLPHPSSYCTLPRRRHLEIWLAAPLEAPAGRVTWGRGGGQLGVGPPAGHAA